MGIAALAGFIAKAVALYNQYKPIGTALAPFVKGAVTAMVHTNPTPQNPDGSEMTPEQVEAYRADVLAGLDRLDAKLETLSALADHEREKAAADLLADAQG